MKLTLLSGTANQELAEAVASSLNLRLGLARIERFPDDEIHVNIQEDIRERDVFLMQSTNPPVADHLLELLLLADASRRRGAGRLTAVIPYFCYARQDRGVKKGEPVAARLLADVLSTRIDRVVALDLHNPAIEGFFNVPVEHLSAVDLLTEALQPSISEDSVLEAPDLGAVKLAQRYADILKLPVAYARKARISGHEVRVRQLMGDIKDQSPVLVDDMISTGNTMISTMEQLLDNGCNPHLTLVASHGLFKDALKKFAGFPIQKILVTDSVDRADLPPPLSLEVASLKDLIAETIERLHYA